MSNLRHPLIRRRASARWQRFRREAAFSDRPALAGLVVLAVAITVLGYLNEEMVPYTAMLLPMFLGSLWLWPRSLPWFVLFCLVGLAFLVSAQTTVTWRTGVRVMVTLLIALIILYTSRRRSTLGVSGPRGESMLVDLRDRIHKLGVIPALASQWDITSSIRTAGGTQFAGDFIGASLNNDGRDLELMVVDVSGKGVEAGTRALLLSGAFGGLASALPHQSFLAEANEYVLKQDWGEGFATAVHLHLDLRTGDFEIRKAGHPPAVWLHAGSGDWSVLDSDGPILGLLPDGDFVPVCGQMQSGDALLLYTDGLVETIDRDLSSGIDKLAGRGQLLFKTGFHNGAQRLVDQLSNSRDDGAIVLVHRL